MSGVRSTSSLARRLSGALSAMSMAMAFALGTADAATVIRNGTVTMTGTVTISSAVKATDTISAAAELATYDSTSFDSQSMLTDNVTVKRSANTATISVSLPYSFVFDAARAGSAKMTATVTLYVNNTQAYASSGPLAVPPSGRTTPLTFRFAL